MAKERRAIEDEAIQRDVAKENVRVSDRHAVDLSTTAEAYRSKAGALLSPRVLSNLLGTVDAVLDARRDDWLTNVRLKTDDWLTETNIERKKVELTEQLNQDTEVSKRTRDLDAEYLDLFNQLTRENVPNSKEIIENKVLEIEDQINKDENLSYYMTSRLLAENSRLGTDYTKKAIDADYELAENKALYEQTNSGMYNRAKLFMGENTLPQAMSNLESMLHSHYKVTDIDDMTTFRSEYNKTFKAYAELLKQQVKAGLLSPEKALEYLNTEFINYRYRKFETTDPKTGKLMEVEVALEPETYVDAIEDILGAKTTKSYSAATNIVNYYNDKVGAGKVNEKGKASPLQSSYYANTSRADSLAQYNNNDLALQQEEQSGNTQATKERQKLAETYVFVTYPSMGVVELIRSNLEKNGYNVSLTLNELALIRDELQKYADNPTGKELPEISITDSTGSVITSLTLPADSPAMKQLSLMAGWGAEATDRAYAQSMLNILDNTINDIKKNPSLVLNTFPSIWEARQKLKDAASIDKLVLISESGKAYVNKEGLLKLQGAIIAYEDELESRANGNPALMNSKSVFDIQEFASNVKGRSLEEQVLYTQLLAQVNTEVGNTDLYTMGADLSGLNKEEADFAKDYCAYGYLLQDGNLSNGYLGKINNYKASGVTFTSNEIQKSTGVESLDNQIYKVFEKYNIEAEYHQGLMHTAYTMAAATMHADKESKFDIKDFEALVDANFYKNGIYKFGAGVRGVPVETLNATMEKYSKAANKAFKALGVEGVYTAKINSRSGKVYLEDQRGNYLTLEGMGGSIPGFAGKEVSFITVPPKGVNEHNFNTGMSVLHNAGILAAGMIGIGTNIRAQKFFEDKGFTQGDYDRLHMEGFKVMAFLADEQNQEAWVKFVQSGYSNQVLDTSAPPELREAFIKSMNGVLYTGQPTREQQRMLYKFIDFMYSYGNLDVKGDAGSSYMRSKKMVTAIGTNTNNAAQGLGEVTNVERVLSSAGAGWKMTSKPGQEYDKNGNPIHAENGAHPKFKAMDVGFDGGFLRGCDARGVLKIEKADALLKAFEDEGYMQNIDFIYYSKPDMLHDSEIAKLKKKGALPKNWEREPGYEKYGKMVNSKGEPLFRYAARHSDHLHIEFNKAMWDKQGKPLPKEFAGITASTIQANLNKDTRLGFTSERDAQFYAEAGQAYEPTAFTEKVTGVKAKEILTSPILQAQAFGTEYKTYENVLGSKDLADYAMAGYNFKLTYVVDYTYSDLDSSYAEGLGGLIMAGVNANPILKPVVHFTKDIIEDIVNSRDRWKSATTTVAGTLLGAPAEGIARALSAPADKVIETVKEGPTEDGKLQKSKTLTEGLPVMDKYQDNLTYYKKEDGAFLGRMEVEKKSFTAQDLVEKNILQRINTVADMDGTWVVIVDEKSETPEKKKRLQEIRRIRKSW